MAFGAVGESLRRATGSSEDSNGSLVLSAGNMDRLVAKLSKMRGAALKLGQMMSIQGETNLNVPLLFLYASLLKPYKIQKPCQHQYRKFFSGFKTVLIICLLLNETRCW